jgi:mRNA-degrading endonuclease RelE of RelBE toxin-antitoxin system
LPELRLSTRARNDLADLPQPLREAVRNALDSLQADPWAKGKPLRGHLRPLWSARVGRYRILYTIEGSEPSAVVVVRGIRHRTVAYRRRRAGE